jgi:hypothetical protein
MKFLRNQPLPGRRLTRRPIDLLDTMRFRLAFEVRHLAFAARFVFELDFKRGQNL